MNASTLRTVVLLLVTLTSAACSTTPPRQTDLMRTVPNYEASSAETRTLIRAYAQRFAQIVEGAADEEYYATEDPRVRKALLLWKSRMVPLSQGTCYLRDPLAALIDTWALVVQARQYAETPRSHEYLGPAWSTVIEACRLLELEIEAIARKTMSGEDISGPRRFIEAWAAEHPIDPRWLTRQTMLADLDLEQRADNDELSALARIASLTEEMNDLTRRLSLYGEFMPRQMRWQAEIVAGDLGIRDLTIDLSTAVPELLPLARDAIEAVAAVPAMIEGQSAMLMKQLDRQRELALEFITASRLDVQAWMKLELDSSIERISAERIETIDALRDELQLVTAQVTAEREAAVVAVGELMREQWALVRDELPAVGGATVERSSGGLEAVVDHAFLRLAQLLGAALVLCFLGGLVLIFVARR